MIIKRFWTYNRSGKKRGRKATSKETQDLILTMKNENLVWGVKKIQGELIKLDIFLDTKTIWNILRSFRRKGKIKNYEPEPFLPYISILYTLWISLL